MTLYLLFATTGMLAYAVAPELAFVATLLLASFIALSRTRPVRTHAAIVTLVFGSAVTIAIAATRQPGEQLADARSNGSPAVVVATDSAGAEAAGEQLFRELGCVRCHRPDGEGIGPSLTGVFGRPVPYPGSGAPIADEEYVRESILNPSATVADGFAPVMPAFAGKVTEDQLLALIAHLKSLKGNTP